jgi:hypothetical protein
MNWTLIVAVAVTGVVVGIALFFAGYALGYAEGMRSRRPKGTTLYR